MVKKLFLIIFTNLIIFLVGIQTVKAQTLDASFSFSPSSEQFKIGCTSSVSIMIDTGSNTSNAANIIINYDPDEVEIIDSNSSASGVQIMPGNAYEAYADNVVDTSTGKIRLTGFSISNPLSGSSTFAIIYFRSKSNVTETDFSIYFAGKGNTLDSNIAEMNTSDDILSSVTNGSYTFVEGECVNDNEGPIITPIDPENYSINIPSNKEIQVKICDLMSGVDISTIEITIMNDEIYTMADTENFIYSGDTECYSITIYPENPLPSDALTLVSFKATDLKGNWSNLTIIFNVPLEANKCDEQIENNVTNITNQLNECKEDLAELGILPETGTENINNAIFGKTGSISQKIGFPPAMISLIALIILLLHPYFKSHIWKVFKDNEIENKDPLTDTEKTLKDVDPILRILKIGIFIIGTIIAIVALYDSISFISVLTISLYLLTFSLMMVLKVKEK